MWETDDVVCIGKGVDECYLGYNDSVKDLGSLGTVRMYLLVLVFRLVIGERIYSLNREFTHSPAGG